MNWYVQFLALAKRMCTTFYDSFDLNMVIPKTSELIQLVDRKILFLFRKEIAFYFAGKLNDTVPAVKAQPFNEPIIGMPV